MPSESYTNSAAIGTTPFSLPNNSTTLTPITADGTYQVWINFAAMLADHEYRIQIVEKTTSAGSQIKSMPDTYLKGVQSFAFLAPSVIFLHGWDVIVNKEAGSTDATILWSIRSAA